MDAVVSPETLALRMRVTVGQARQFLEAIEPGISWRELAQLVGGADRFPICYSAAEVAKMLAVSASMVRRLVRTGQLKAVAGMRPIRVPATLISGFLNRSLYAGGELSYATGTMKKPASQNLSADAPVGVCGAAFGGPIECIENVILRGLFHPGMAAFDGCLNQPQPLPHRGQRAASWGRCGRCFYLVEHEPRFTQLATECIRTVSNFGDGRNYV